MNPMEKDNRGWGRMITLAGIVVEEGKTNHPDIQALRLRQIKKLLDPSVFFSGNPHASDGRTRLRRTQQGNNNAYCQGQ